VRLFSASLAALAALVVVGVAAAAAVSGSVFGPIVSVSGTSFKLTTTLSPTGSSTVSIGSSTAITEQVTASSSSVHAGVCVSAVGSRSTSGVVSALRITISQPQSGKCTNGFGGGFGGRGGTGGRPPGLGAGGAGSNGPRPGAGAAGGGGGGFAGGGFNRANFGFASGGVTAVKGTTFTVQAKRNGKTTKTTVDITKSTMFTEIDRVDSGSVKTKLCAFVYGTSSDRGKTVKAQTISLTTPTSNGCNGGFRRPGG